MSVRAPASQFRVLRFLALGCGVEGLRVWGLRDLGFRGLGFRG